MSAFQRVNILEVRDCVVVLEVVEVHPDMDALSHVIADSAARASIALQLLIDYEGRDNTIMAEAQRILDEEEDYPPVEHFIREVELRSHEVLDVNSQPHPQHRAEFAVTLTRPDYASGFAATDLDYGSYAVHGKHRDDLYETG